MRLKYLEQDRKDLSETVKCLARDMSAPREFHLLELKRAVRFLKGTPAGADGVRRAVQKGRHLTRLCR